MRLNGKYIERNRLMDNREQEREGKKERGSKRERESELFSKGGMES